MENIEGLVESLENALLAIDRVKVEEIIKQNCSDMDFELLERMVTQALERIGAGWENGSVSLSQVYISGAICEELIEQYLPKCGLSYREEPKIAIAVLLDYHSLGKKIVYSILRAGGYNLLDFGHGLSVDELVQKTIDNKVDVLLISALMLPSALKIAAVIDSLKKQKANVKVIVGGAPFRMDPGLWKKLGADADGKNAVDIIKIIEALIPGGKKK